MSPFFGYHPHRLLCCGSTGLCGWRRGDHAEITAIGVYVQFWFPEMAHASITRIDPTAGVHMLAAVNLARVEVVRR